MKAKLIEQVVYEGTIAWAHGMGRTVVRFLLQDADGLVVVNAGYGDDDLVAFRIAGISELGKAEVFEEVEVDDGLLHYARAYIEAKKKLDTYWDHVDERSSAALDIRSLGDSPAPPADIPVASGWSAVTTFGDDEEDPK